MPAPRRGSGGSARVLPNGLVISTPSKPPSPPSCRARICSAITCVWDHTQVSYRGAYSVERLYAFEEYCRHASLCRVVLVCTLAPLPPLVVMLLMESVPLRSPALGWQANYVFFGRSLCCAFVVAMAILLQVKNIFPDLQLTTRECAQVSACVAALTTGCGLLLASYWVFPIPYTMTLMIGPFLGALMPTAVGMIGVKRIALLSDGRNRLRRFAVLIAIQATLPLVYPVYAVLYSQLTTPSAQVACIAVLPVIKQLLKILLVRHATATVHDYVPEIVVFSIDAFHSIYLCACMEVTNSPWTKAVVILLDVAHHVLSLAGISRRTEVVRELFAMRAPIFRNRSLCAIAVDMFAHPNCLDARAFANVRLRSCLHHHISRQASRVIRRLSISHPSQMPKEDEAITYPEITATPCSVLPIPLIVRRQSTDDLLVLADVMRPTNKRTASQSRRKNVSKILRIQPRRSVSSTRSTDGSVSSASGLAMVTPRGPSPNRVAPPPVKMLSGRRSSPAFSSTGKQSSQVEAAKRHHRLHVFDVLGAEIKTKLAHQSLALLFTVEYLSLAEYVELIVPLVYTVYVPVLVHLPNFQFHTMLSTILNTTEALLRATLNVAIYGLLEATTFVAFHFVMQKWLRVSPLYSVAFVLENQIEMIEGKLLAWFLFAVQYPLVHCRGFAVYAGRQ